MRPDEPDEPELVEIGPTHFVETGSLGFGIAFITHRDTVPLVSVIAVDLATDQETRHDVHPGEPFQAAGQTWQVASFREGSAASEQPASDLDDEWEVVLRRTDGRATP
jgi:hypothetical protein